MGLKRRHFLCFAAGLGAGAMASPLPWKLLDDVSIWSQNRSRIPSPEDGENSYVPVTSKTCPSCAALAVRLVDGRPVRVLPRNDHPLGGGLTALAAAETHLLHSSSRVLEPLLKGPDGTFSPIAPDRAEALLREKLAGAGKNLAVLSGEGTGSMNEVLSAFAASLGSSSVFLMPSEAQAAAIACDRMGIDAEIGYDLEHSDHVLAIGADVMESWGTVARNRRILSSGKTTLTYAGPVRNGAVGARTWVPIYPGTEAVLAMGIAALLIARGRTAPVEGFEAFKALAAQYPPKTVSALTGASQQILHDAANALETAAAPLVIMGGDTGRPASPANIMAGIGLNAALGVINTAGGLLFRPPAGKVLDKAQTRRELFRNDLMAALAGGLAPDALLIYEANPLFALPGASGLTPVFENIPFKVCFTTLMDETAVASDLVMPLPMGLERLDDVHDPYGCGQGIYCLTAPAATPPVPIRDAADTLFSLARAMGLELGGSSWEGLLKAKAALVQADYQALLKGAASASGTLASVDGMRLQPDLLAEALAAPAPEGTLRLAPYSRLGLGTSKTGIPPHNTKILRPSELEGKDLCVMLNGFTARSLGLLDGQRVRLSAGKNSVTALLRVRESVVNGTAAVCCGFGHTALDSFSRGRGANVMEVVRARAEQGVGVFTWNRTTVTIAQA